jgi:TRAP-type C4-dicarboxylate transport system permease large subunit
MTAKVIFKGGLGMRMYLRACFSGLVGAAVSDAAGLGRLRSSNERRPVIMRSVDRIYTAFFPLDQLSASIPMVFYADQGSVSVGALFLGGLIQAC